MSNHEIEMFHGGTFDEGRETEETFPYADVDIKFIGRLHELDDIMFGCIKRTQEDMATMGACLLEAKACLPHGQFTKWYKVRYGLSKTTAWRMMQVAQGKTLTSKAAQDLLPQKTQSLDLDEDMYIEIATEVITKLCYASSEQKRWDELPEEEQELRIQNWHDMLESAPKVLHGENAPLLCKDIVIAVGKRYQENKKYLSDAPYDQAIIAMVNRIKWEVDSFYVVAKIITDETYTDQAKIDLDLLEKRGKELGVV